MKKLLILLVLLSAIAKTNAQSAKEFTIAASGITDFIVTDVPDKTKADLYKKTVEWVKSKYKDAKIIEKTENESVTFEASVKPLVSLNPVARTNYLSRFQIQVTLKDGKYKFDLLSLEYLVPPSQADAGGWAKINLENATDYFTRTGELRNTYKYFSEIPTYFNTINSELKQYIIAGETAAKKSDW